MTTPRKRTPAQQHEHERHQAELRDFAVRDGDHPEHDTLKERFDHELPERYR